MKPVLAMNICAGEDYQKKPPKNQTVGIKGAGQQKDLAVKVF